MVDEPWALLKQAQLSNNTNHPQKDGWGVAWYGPEGAAAKLNKKPVFDTVQEFRVAVASAHGPIVIAHIREKSGSLPPKEKDAQPFVLGGTIFPHNGTVRKKDRVKDALLPGVCLQGDNDSEVFFRILQMNISRVRDPIVAYQNSVRQIRSNWPKYKGAENRPPHSALNVLFSPSANDLYAFCLFGPSDDVDIRGERKKRFTDNTERFYEMAYLASDKEVVIASEPLNDQIAWKPLKNGFSLHAWRDGDSVTCGPPIEMGLPTILSA